VPSRGEKDTSLWSLLLKEEVSIPFPQEKGDDSDDYLEKNERASFFAAG